MISQDHQELAMQPNAASMSDGGTLGIRQHPNREQMAILVDQKYLSIDYTM
jgi:hypothetical protein